MSSRHLVLLCMVVIGQSVASHRAQASLPDHVLQCKALARADFSGTRDAPTHVIDATPVNGTDESLVCHVKGYVSPNVRFDLVLPASRWNGKLIQLGCGGFCGASDPGPCADLIRRGYACIVSDNGHSSSAGDALWAYNNLQAEVDHAYRGAHVVALAGKAIVESHYGDAPKRSYFMGSSTGGRQALMLAQRFPWDFDGIIGGVPSLSVTGIHMNLLWGNRALMDNAGQPVLSQPDLDLLHRAVLANCDLNDGIRDGLIGDPRACLFDPIELRCKSHLRGDCLTTTQIDAVRKIYSGAVTSDGESVYMPAALKGSERTWLNWFSTLFSDNPRATYNFVRDEFRYSGFQPNPGPSWKPEDFDFDRDYKRLGLAEALSSAVNPDLRKFKAAGGRLLVYAGWSDAAGMPLHTVDYYEAAERIIGDRTATQNFFRLFVVPGMGHGGYSEGVFAVDWLSYLEAWVEKGQPPDRVVSFRVKTEDLRMNIAADVEKFLRRTTFPLERAGIDLSRPVYPYPIVATYLGRGDPKDAASFGPKKP